MASLDAVAALQAVTPPVARRNALVTRAAWEAERAACAADPGSYHGDIAASTLHWFDAALGSHGAWITRNESSGTWTGWDAGTLEPVTADYATDWRPWTRALNDDDAPFYRWFSGGRTNAAFNEVDRHVLAGCGDEPAFLVEGDR